MLRPGSWDVVVVGGGTAGIVASRTAASVGARVLLIERARTGGDCLWTGCVPSKAFLSAARHAVDARRAHGLGVRGPAATVDFTEVMAHVKGAIAAIQPEDSPETLRRAGVQVMSGEARFLTPDRLEVDACAVPFRRAVIATGSGPAVPPIPGLRASRPLTSDTVWDLGLLPHRLVVLGGGAIGCELGQAFVRLGTQVTIVEALPRLLASEDPDAAHIVHSALVDDGIQVLTGHQATEVRGEPDGPGVLVLSSGEGTDAEQVQIGYDRLLVAVGRTPTTRDLGLDDAGVAVDDRGHVVVDDTLHQQSTHLGGRRYYPGVGVHAHCRCARGHRCHQRRSLGLRRTVDLTSVPRVTYTDPELAAVGEPTWIDGDRPAPRTVTRRHDRVDSGGRGTHRGVHSTDSGAAPSDHRRHGRGTSGRRDPRRAHLAVCKGLTTGDIAGTPRIPTPRTGTACGTRRSKTSGRGCRRRWCGAPPG